MSDPHQQAIEHLQSIPWCAKYRVYIKDRLSEDYAIFISQYIEKLEAGIKDATRDEAIMWCIDNQVDFTKPRFPPPVGWMWGNTGVEAKALTSIFTNNNDDDGDIESVDVLLRVEGMIHGMVKVISEKHSGDIDEARLIALDLIKAGYRK